MAIEVGPVALEKLEEEEKIYYVWATWFLVPSCEFCELLQKLDDELGLP